MGQTITKSNKSSTMHKIGVESNASIPSNKIFNITEWTHLSRTTFDKGSDAENIAISKMGDLHPFSPSPQFPNCKRLFITCCDKNFVYYWMNPQTFPAVEEIYLDLLDSDACKYAVFAWWSTRNITMYLSPNYGYGNQNYGWATKFAYVFEATDEQYNKVVENVKL